MKTTPKILAFAGSLRKESFNKTLVKIAMAGAIEAGAEVTFLDLRDIPMPIFDQDLEAEEGLPPNAQKFKELLLTHHGLLIASPEYNSSITAVLKNAIDWASRPVKDEPQLACFVGKVVSLMSASPGGWGGMRGLVHIRSILSNIGVIVLPDQVCIAKAYEAFKADGTLNDEHQQVAVKKLGTNVATMLAKLQVDFSATN